MLRWRRIILFDDHRWVEEFASYEGWPADYYQTPITERVCQRFAVDREALIVVYRELP